MKRAGYEPLLRLVAAGLCLLALGVVFAVGLSAL